MWVRRPRKNLALLFVLLGVAGVRRNILRTLYAAIVVFLIAEWNPNVALGNEYKQKPHYVVDVERIRISDESLENHSPDFPSIGSEHFFEAIKLGREISGPFLRKAGRAHLIIRQQTPPIFQWVERCRGVDRPLQDNIFFHEFMEKGGGLPTIYQAKFHPPVSKLKLSIRCPMDARIGIFKEYVWALGFDDCVGLLLRGFSIFESRIGGFCTVFDGSSNQPQLPIEQTNLNNRGSKQSERGVNQSPSRYSDPPFVRRFLVALLFIPLGFGCALCGGEYFYRKRILLGAALAGVGFLSLCAGLGLIMLNHWPSTWEWWI